VTLRELLNDQGIDPNALLRQEVGTTLKDGGGITARLEDGVLDLHVIVHKNALPKRQRKGAKK
jgi:hypothetical protein